MEARDRRVDVLAVLAHARVVLVLGAHLTPLLAQACQVGAPLERLAICEAQQPPLFGRLAAALRAPRHLDVRGDLAVPVGGIRGLDGAGRLRVGQGLVEAAELEEAIRTVAQEEAARLVPVLAAELARGRRRRAGLGFLGSGARRGARLLQRRPEGGERRLVLLNPHEHVGILAVVFVADLAVAELEFIAGAQRGGPLPLGIFRARLALAARLDAAAAGAVAGLGVARLCRLLRRTALGLLRSHVHARSVARRRRRRRSHRSGRRRARRGSGDRCLSATSAAQVYGDLARHLHERLAGGLGGGERRTLFGHRLAGGLAGRLAAAAACERLALCRRLALRRWHALQRGQIQFVLERARWWGHSAGAQHALHRSLDLARALVPVAENAVRMVAALAVKRLAHRLGRFPCCCRGGRGQIGGSGRRQLSAPHGGSSTVLRGDERRTVERVHRPVFDRLQVRAQDASASQDGVRVVGSRLEPRLARRSRAGGLHEPAQGKVVGLDRAHQVGGQLPEQRDVGRVVGLEHLLLPVPGGTLPQWLHDIPPELVLHEV